MKPVAPRQLEVLQFVHAFRQQHDFAPTHREICDAIGITSTNGVNDHLSALERKGLLRRAPMKSRALTITPAGLQELNLAASRAQGAQP